MLYLVAKPQQVCVIHITSQANAFTGLEQMQDIQSDTSILLSMLQRMLKRMMQQDRCWTCQIAQTTEAALKCSAIQPAGLDANLPRLVQIAKLVQKLPRDVLICEQLAVPAASNCLDVLSLAGQTYCITFSMH